MGSYADDLADGCLDEVFALDAHTAASVGDLEHLIALDAKDSKVIDGQNVSGWTPIMYAAYCDHADVVAFLASRGARGLRPEAPAPLGTKGRSSLMLAAMCGNESTAKEIIKRFAALAVSEADDQGMTALMHATVCGHASMTRILLEAGSKTEAAEITRGYTPLMLAAKEGHHPVARTLVNHGADSSAANILGETAVSVAKQFGHDALAAFLAVSAAKGSSPASAETPHDVPDVLQGPKALAERMARQAKQQKQRPQSSVLTVREFLVEAGMADFSGVFASHGVNDLDHLLSLKDEDLKAMGIVKMGPRRRMTSAIARRKEL